MDSSNHWKPYGGEIKFWCRHIITKHLPKDFLDEKFAENPNYSGEFFTGQVIKDALARWPAGSSMCSSPIVFLDEKTLKVETENTHYQLVGPGRISYAIPSDYWEEVGKTIILLSEGHDLAVTGDKSILVFPDKTEDKQR